MCEQITHNFSCLGDSQIAKVMDKEEYFCNRCASSGMFLVINVLV